MKRNLTISQTEVVFTKDDVIVPKLVSDIPGGRTIDFTGWTGDNIKAGTVIIKGTVSSAIVYRPHPITAGTAPNPDTYGTITEGFAVCGILYRTITRTDPQGSILIQGVVNEAAAQAAGLPAYTSAIKAALTDVQFISDEEA
jgi:hypothetical protein